MVKPDMRKILLLVFITFFSVGLSGQIQIPASINPGTNYIILSPVQSPAMAIGYINGVKTIHYGSDAPPGVMGTPFLDINFVNGEIGVSDSIILTDLPIRYNAYKDQMQFISTGDTLGVQPSYLLNYVRIGNTYFIFSLIYDKYSKEFTKGYFQLLAGDKVKLLLRHQKTLKYDAYVTSYMGGGGDKKYHFIDKKAYYTKSGREAALKLSRSRKGVLNAFPEQREEMAKYAEENGLSFRKETDLIRLFDHYNTLVRE